jgi:porin
MAVSFRAARGWLGGSFLAAFSLLGVLSQPVVGEEFADVFEFAALDVLRPVAGGLAADEEATVDEQWDAAEAEMIDAPCDCNSGECYCQSSPGLKERLEACMKSMASQGITYAPGATQFYQGVTHGGIEEGFEYGGKIDQFLILDGGKLIGCEGGSLTMHVETRFGQDVNFDAVGLAPVNVAMLYPNFDEHDTAITGFLLGQYLDEEWQAAAGKYNALDLFYSLYPQTGRGVNTFMNASMVVPISVARVVPLSFMGVGLTKYHDKKPQASVIVFDNQNVTTTSGFDDMFENGANIMGFYRFFTEMGGLPGSHGFGGIWATGEYVSFDPLSFAILPGQGLVADRESGAFTLLYILEQTLWVDRCNKERSIGLLSQWGIADEETSPFAWSCNVAIQATGLNRSRPKDSIGIGYFHTGLSDDFVDALSPVFDLQDVDGIELYYNAAVAECFQLTADLQVVEPAEEQFDTAVVFGLRGTIGM